LQNDIGTGASGQGGETGRFPGTLIRAYAFALQETEMREWRSIMRRILLAASAFAALLAVPTLASAQYYAADPYGAVPGTVYGAVPGTVVVNPPLVQGQVYLAPGQTYVAPGTAYQDQAIVIEGRRYYRDCWWDWGQRRCELKPWW
jgi:hypothetical protein